MGLDITAYSRLGELVQTDFSPEPVDFDSCEFICPNRSFLAQADGIVEGWYRIDESDSHSFRAGSYGSYSQFRGEVIRSLHGISDSEYWNDKSFDGTPLRDWLHFSDCEGVIGPKTSRKLFDECMSVNDKVVAQLRANGDDAWYLVEKWNEWVKAFSLAADGGCVVFG